MKSFIKLLIGLFFCILVFKIYGHYKQSANLKANPAASLVRELSPGDISVAKLDSLSDSLPFTGTLTAPNSAQVSAEVSGTARRVLVREGERVKAGQTLALLDNESLHQSLLEQQAQLRNQQSRLQLAQIKLKRQRELLNKGFISQLAFDEAKSDFAISKGEFAAQAAQLARARKSLNDTLIKAPISGVIYERKVNPGEQVGVNSVLFAIADLSQLEISASLSSRYIAKVQVGQTALFKVDGLPQAFEAKVVRINPVADNSTRTFIAYLQVNNPGELKAGQFATGGIILNEIKDVVVLPLSALNNQEKSPWVMLIENNKLQQKAVKILAVSQADNKVAISGVNVGSYILTTALLGVKSGDAVKLAK